MPCLGPWRTAAAFWVLVLTVLTTVDALHTATKPTPSLTTTGTATITPSVTVRSPSPSISPDDTLTNSRRTFEMSSTRTQSRTQSYSLTDIRSVTSSTSSSRDTSVSSSRITPTRTQGLPTTTNTVTPSRSWGNNSLSSSETVSPPTPSMTGTITVGVVITHTLSSSSTRYATDTETVTVSSFASRSSTWSVTPTTTVSVSTSDVVINGALMDSLSTTETWTASDSLSNFRSKSMSGNRTSTTSRPLVTLSFSPSPSDSSTPTNNRTSSRTPSPTPSPLLLSTTTSVSPTRLSPSADYSSTRSESFTAAAESQTRTLSTSLSFSNIFGTMTTTESLSISFQIPKSRTVLRSRSGSSSSSESVSPQPSPSESFSDSPSTSESASQESTASISPTSSTSWSVSDTKDVSISASSSVTSDPTWTAVSVTDGESSSHSSSFEFRSRSISASATITSVPSSSESLSTTRGTGSRESSLTWSPSATQRSSSREQSLSWSMATSRRFGGSPSLSPPTKSDQRSPSVSESLSAEPSGSSSASMSALRRTCSATDTQSPSKKSKSPSSSSVVTHSPARPTPTYDSGTPTTTRHRNTLTHFLSESMRTVTLTAASLSMGFVSGSETLGRMSATNYNKSITNSKSRHTYSYGITLTKTVLRTLTLTQTIPLRLQVSNALGQYFLNAFDLTAVASGGLCAAVPMFLTALLVALTVIAIVVLVYRRFVKKQRPGDESVASLTTHAWSVLLRENVYTGIISPCHFHCWWIHALTLLFHLNAIFLLVVYLSYQLDGRQQSLVAGSGALVAFVALLSAMIPHLGRPAIDYLFHVVTFEEVNRRKCMNERGDTWAQWEARCRRQRKEKEARDNELRRMQAEDERRGLHLIKAAMMADVDEHGWQEPTEQLKHSSVVEVDAEEKGEVAAEVVVEDDILFEDVAQLREATLRMDLGIGDDDSASSSSHVTRVEKQHGGELHKGLSIMWDVVGIGTQLSQESPLSMPWWGPVETHHLLSGAVLTTIIIVLVSAFQNAVSGFASQSCDSRNSSVPQSLLVAVVVDFVVGEPCHQLLRLALRYATEPEGTVDYSTTFARRVSKLIVELSLRHPYRGEMKLWPEDSLSQLPP